VPTLVEAGVGYYCRGVLKSLISFTICSYGRKDSRYVALVFVPVAYTLRVLYITDCVRWSSTSF